MKNYVPIVSKLEFNENLDADLRIVSGLDWVITHEVFEQNIELFDTEVWYGLSANRNLRWNDEFIERYTDKWDWSRLSYNPAIPWSLPLISKFESKWNWSELSGNQGIIWTDEIIKKYKEKLNFSTTEREDTTFGVIKIQKGIDSGLIGTLSDDLVYENVLSGKWNNKFLTSNKELNWTIELFRESGHNIHFEFWEYLSSSFQNLWTDVYEKNIGSANLPLIMDGLIERQLLRESEMINSTFPPDEIGEEHRRC